MKKVLIISLVAILVLAAGAFFYSRKPQVTGKFYEERVNNVGFDKGDKWFVSATAGNIRVTEDQADTSKPSVLIKTQDLDSTIEALGLDKAPQVKIGDKTLRRLDRSVTPPGGFAKTVTLTQLLWVMPGGRPVIFEITPWQKPVFDPGMKDLISTFKSL